MNILLSKLTQQPGGSAAGPLGASHPSLLAALAQQVFALDFENLALVHLVSCTFPPSKLLNPECFLSPGQGLPVRGSGPGGGLDIAALTSQLAVMQQLQQQHVSLAAGLPSSSSTILAAMIASQV